MPPFDKYDKAAVAKALDGWEEQLKDTPDGQVIDRMASMGFRQADVQLFLARRKLKPALVPDPVGPFPDPNVVPEELPPAVLAQLGLTEQPKK